MATRMTAQEDAQAAELIAQGQSYREVAQELGRSDKSIVSAVARHKSRKGKTLDEDLAAMVLRRKGRLEELEWKVLRHRLGLKGFKRLTLQELADQELVSRQRIHQIEQQALEKITEDR